MGQPVKIAVVIPAYNEEANIASVVDAINNLRAENLRFTPVVVNDCSRDTTGELISQLKCVSLHLPINLGIGGAVQTGVKYAFNNGFDFAVQIDGDGQHPPEFIPMLVAELKTNHWDVAIGSRFIDRQGFQSTFARRNGIRFLQWLLERITGRSVTDPTSGMRLMSRKAMKVVYDFYPDEYPEPEAIILYHRRGLTFGEVPVRMNERLGGESSIRGLRGCYYMFKVTIAIVFTYLRK
jgi:glycosyltransferase involved in cell wall biosynthesis